MVSTRKRRPSAPPYIYDNDRLEEQLLELGFEPDDRDRLYVYRWKDGKRIKPALYVGRPFEGLESYLRDKHDGGEFNVMIRRGETMQLNGLIGICPLPSRKEAFEAFRGRYR